jgi:hypothetical protein
MNSENRQEIYRVALETACLELGEITAEFEKLRIRKDQVEKLIAVLKPVIGEEENAAIADTSAKAEQQAEATGGEPVSTTDVAIPTAKQEGGEPLGVGADPFQRRIDHVLGIGAGIRDVRQYTRQF